MYIREYFDCVELEDSDNNVECVWCVWVGIRGKANQAGIPVEVCYRRTVIHNQDKLFYKWLTDVSQ